MFLINHGIDTYDTQDINRLLKEKDPHIGEMLFKNENDYFFEVTQSTGIINNKLGFGLGIGISDLNNDNYPDVYVSNDYSGKDHLYINQQNGTFKEGIDQLTNQISFYAMGNDIADINNDGWQDIVNLDMVAADNYGIKTSMSAMNPEQFSSLVNSGEHYQYMFNSLLLNNGSPNKDRLPFFSNISQLAGISSTDWSWGPLLFDMDNDGWQDLFISNGIKRNIRNNDAMKVVNKLNERLKITHNEQEKAQLMQAMLQQFPYHRRPNYFFLNNGQLNFEDITTQIGMDSLATASNGAAYADFDLDGDLDLIINNVDQPAMLLKNNATAINDNHTLTIELKGALKNPLGIGSKVIIKHRDGILSKEVYTTRGYQSAISPNLHFGFGTAKIVDSLEIIWPDGKTQKLNNIQQDKLVLHYTNAVMDDPKETIATSIFTEDTTLLTYQHQENKFDDFKRESLLPHKMSNMGPAVAVGDVNNDGTMDVFLGGAKGQSAVLYTQQQDGKFLPTNELIWQTDSHLEDVKAIFLDVDKDADLDLVVGSGSNEWIADHEAYRLRFYENIGQGKFSKNETAFPDIRVSVGAIAAGDFDEDGDEDLFIGGRQIPNQYPLPTDSYLLRNESTSDNIQFKDITTSHAPFLQNFGMITDALWADLNGDKRIDLVTVGEWMSPNIFLNEKEQFINFTKNANLAAEKGWWYSISAADVDKDGDIDLIGGNLGLNYKYKASLKEPFEIFTNDFDQNGSQDIVLSYNAAGSKFPLRGRECSSNQMPFIKKKFPTYDAFGKATMQEVFDPKKLNTATHFEANNFAHCYFENEGNGSFKVQLLPIATQISSINACLIADFDGDAQLDILAGGNLYESEVETPRNDASFGQLLKGNGSGDFQLIPTSKSGLQIKGEVRALLPFKLQNQKQQHILVIVNDDIPKFLQLNVDDGTFERLGLAN